MTEIETSWSGTDDLTFCSVKIRDGKEVVLNRTFTLRGKVENSYEIMATAVGLQYLKHLGNI